MVRQSWSHGLLAALFFAGGTHAATAQTAALKADVYSPDELKHLRAELQAKAEKNGGAASQVLEHYPQHHTMLAFRSQSGGAERHEHFTDFFVVIEGSATLVTGGEITGAKTTAPGEILGTAIDSGTQRLLHAGDIAHIPAGLPHQIKLQSGGSILYYVIKVQESPAP